MTVDGFAVATLVLDSGVVAATLAQGLTLLREQIEHRANGKMAALAAVVAIERFSYACTEFVTDTRIHPYRVSRIELSHLDLPVLSPLERGDGFNRLPIQIASMLLEFECLADQASHDPVNMAPENHIEIAAPAFLHLGQAGFDVAQRVRKTMGLGLSHAADVTHSLANPSGRRLFEHHRRPALRSIGQQGPGRKAPGAVPTRSPTRRFKMATFNWASVRGLVTNRLPPPN